MQNIIYLSAFTVFQALCSTLTALFIGLPAAFFTAKRNFIGKKFLLSLSSVPFCVPSLLIALAFVSCFGISGLLNSIIKFFAPDNYSPVALLYSFSGIIIAQGFYNFPLVMKSINDSWKQIPEETAETARLLGAGEWKVFRTITIHQLMPSIASSCMLVFLYCYFSFMIILLFGSVGCSTLEVEVYKAAKITLDFKYAFYLGSLETLLACIFVAFYSLLENKSFKIQGQTFSNHSAAANISSLSEKFFAFIIFSLIFVFFIAPLLSILYNAVSSKNDFLTLKNISHIIQMKGFFKALFTTFFCAVSTGFCSSVLAFLYAVYIRTKDPFSKNLFFRILPMIPLAVSGVILGILITVIIRKGNIILLILAQTFISWPVAFRQIYSSLSKLPQETIDTARIFSTNPLHLLLRIYLPSSLRGILSAFGFCFAVSAGDTTLPLVMAIPNFNTLSLFTYRLAGSYRFHEACASGLILGLICMTVFALANKIKEK